MTQKLRVSWLSIEGSFVQACYRAARSKIESYLTCRELILIFPAKNHSTCRDTYAKIGGPNVLAELAASWPIPFMVPRESGVGADAVTRSITHLSPS